MIRRRLVLLLFALFVTLQLGRMAVDETYGAPSDLATAQDVVIPEGGTAVIAKILRQDGVISYPLIFRAAAWLTRREGPLHAGEFLIPARSSLRQVLEILRQGAPVQHQATIPEGLTGQQIAALLNKLPDATGTIPPPPEGAVLPQTYLYTYGTSRAAILARAEAAMTASLQKAWDGRDRSILLTSPDEALILASIVQEETPLPRELPLIAAVYENRLAQNMDLQADPTVIYAASHGAAAAGLPITRAGLATQSPYNTYRAQGLPPGPICAPGLAAIQAVLHPAASDDLYFVATGTGGHLFSKDYTQHLANVAAYRAITQLGTH